MFKYAKVLYWDIYYLIRTIFNDQGYEDAPAMPTTQSYIDRAREPVVDWRTVQAQINSLGGISSSGVGASNGSFGYPVMVESSSGSVGLAGESVPDPLYNDQYLGQQARQNFISSQQQLASQQQLYWGTQSAGQWQQPIQQMPYSWQQISYQPPIQLSLDECIDTMEKALCLLKKSPKEAIA